MRLALLATVDNIHTRRWIDFFVQQSDIDVFVLCDAPVENPPEGTTLIHPEMTLLTKVVAFKFFPRPYGNNVFKFLPYRRELRRIQPDIIHGFELLGYGLATVWSGLNVPTVLTPWGNDIFDLPHRSRIARWIVKTSLKQADCITTNMPGLEEYLHQAFGIPSEKVRAFSWGVDTGIFHPTSQNEEEEAEQSLRRRLNIPANAVVVLSNRQMQPYWGIEHIVRSAGIVLGNLRHKTTHFNEVYFVFLRGAGSEAFENRMKTLAQELRIAEYCRFVGKFLTPEEMAVYLRMADIFVSVPQSDLLSISVLEGMACGCIPIIADLPSYRTRITDGENGFIVSGNFPQAIAEKILYVMEHPEVKKQFAEKNFRLIHTYDNWHKNAPKMIEIYHSLLQKRNQIQGTMGL